MPAYKLRESITLKRPSSQAHCTIIKLTLPVLLMLNTHCSRGSSSDDMSIETLDSGIVRVTHHNLPDIQLRIDTLAVWNLWDEDSSYVFNRVRGAAGTTGGFYLLDAGNRRVARLNSAGEVELVFGREGAGPGEFQYPRYIDVHAGEIWVGDMMLQRHSIFDLDGTYQRDVRWQSVIFPVGRGFEVLDNDIALFVTESPLGPRYLIKSEVGSGESDTLVTMLSLPEQLLEIHAPDGREITFDTPPEFAPELYWAISGNDRLITVTSTDYCFEERDLEGHINSEVHAPTPDLAVTNRIRELFFEQAEFGFGTDPSSYQASQEIRDKWQFADKRQAIINIRVDPSGRIWVQANTENLYNTRMDIFDSEYGYLGNLGTIPMPMAFNSEGHILVRIPEAGEDDSDLYAVFAISPHN